MRGFTSVALFGAALLDLVSGHATMSFPPARNYVTQYNCPTCANGPSVCGSGPGSQWPADDVAASSLRSSFTTPKVQLVAGGKVQIEAFFSAPHGGFFVLELCPNPGEIITDDCFARLERVETDRTYGPYVASKPTHFFLPDNTCVGKLMERTPLKALFKIPEGVTSDHAILRWTWQSGNSCDATPEQFAQSLDPAISSWKNRLNGIECKAATSNMWSPCGDDCPNSDCLGERFHTCSDVAVVTGDASTTVTSLNAMTEKGPYEKPSAPGGSSGSGMGGGMGSGNAEESEPAPTFIPTGDSAIDKCKSQVRGLSPQWQTLCQDYCAEYAKPDSFGHLWCSQRGLTDLYDCVSQFQAACV